MSNTQHTEQMFSGTPFVMALQEFVCKQTRKAGLFIPEKCLESSGWKKTCNDAHNDGSVCREPCEHSYKGLTQFVTFTKQNHEINGYVINEPRMLILATTGPLKIVDGLNKGTPTKSDFYSYKSDKQSFSIVNRYRILFLDENKQPLHTRDVQFSMKGVGAMKFLHYLKIWSAKINKWCSQNNNKKMALHKYLWVFHPVYELKTYGKAGASSLVCSVADVLFDSNECNVADKYFVDEPGTVAFVTDLRLQCAKWSLNSKRGLTTTENVLDEFAFEDDGDGETEDTFVDLNKPEPSLSKLEEFFSSPPKTKRTKVDF